MNSEYESLTSKKEFYEKIRKNNQNYLCLKLCYELFYLWVREWIKDLKKNLYCSAISWDNFEY